MELDRRVGHEIKGLRVDSALSQQALADAAGIDRSYLSLVERGLREPSLTVLQAVAGALGADLSVRLYPNTGPAIRDRTQTAILEAILRDLAPAWRAVPEVPVRTPARGVIDVVLHRPADHLVVATEIESRIARLEQEMRWSTEKAEALPSSDLWRIVSAAGNPQLSRLMVVRSTRATRDLAVRFEHVLAAAYPAETRLACAALFEAGPWPGPALVWADVTNGTARIRDTPPHGVRVGRVIAGRAG